MPHSLRVPRLGALLVCIGLALGACAEAPDTAVPTVEEREHTASRIRSSSSIVGFLLGIARAYREIFVPPVDFDGDGFADFTVAATNTVDEEIAVFYGGPAGYATVADQIIASPDPTAFLALTTSTNAGDVNGDGYDDLIAGANNAPNGGAAYLFFGGPNGLSATPDQTLSGSNTGLAGTVTFGFSVASIRDLDGDGYDDVAVGAIATSINDVQDGAVFLYLGGPHGVSTVPDYTLFGTGGFLDNFGRRIRATFLDGDAYPDLIISESRSPLFGGSSPGRVLIFDGAPPFDTVVDQVIDGPSGPGQGFGLSLSLAADYNLDGYGDVLVGEGLTDTFTGKAFLYLGSPGGLDPVPALEILPPAGNTGGFFGFSVGAGGDVDRNGLPDLVIGETDADNLAGETHLVFNSIFNLPQPGVTTVIGPDQTLSVPITDPIGFFGQDLAFVGDGDGNLADELLVGASGVNAFTGRVYVFEGSTPLGIPATPKLQIDGTVAGGSFGLDISK
ncbi:MAG: VCBS repeat-containing protein [Myxococcota bacterium]